MPRLFATDHARVASGHDATSSACEMLYPMYVIPVQEFLKLPRLLPHGELLQRGVLKRWQPNEKGKVVLVSHQWLKYSEPDPENEHFAALQGLLTRMMKSAVSKVDDWWLHKAVWQTKAVAVGKADWHNLLLWIDYSCMPQLGPGADARAVLNAAKAVESIPAYVERCNMLLVVAPVCRHKDSGELCNYSTWRGRGWCRMELQCSMLARRSIRTMVTIGESATPFLLHPCEACRLTTGAGHFSCCALGHNLNGVEMSCDKVKVRSVLELMLTNKVQHERSTGAGPEQHFYASLRHALLQDLPLSVTPSLVAAANLRLKSVMEEEQHALEHASCAMERLRARLSWKEEDEASTRVTGFTLLMCAALSDDTEAVRELVSPDGGRAGELNVGLKKGFPHLSYMMQGAVPLIGAMVFGRWETCEALLDAGADPKRFMSNGMDALFAACCKGTLPNIMAWLRRFPDWNIDRVEPGMGLNATCLCALVGSAEVCTVLRTLVESKASISSAKFWGGAESMLCLLASNENVNEDAARFLIQEGCSVNGRWRPQKAVLSAMVKAARLAGRFPHGTAVEEFAVLDGSTPLHFAAKRGDVPLINLLLEARAEPLKNKQGRTPLDVASAFFGGNVPLPLKSSLVNAGAPQPAKTGLPKLLNSVKPKWTKA